MKAISVAEVVNTAEFDPKPPGFWAGFTWFAPAVAMLLAVTLYPTGMVLWLSVHRTRLYEVVDGVGLANYATVLTSPAFLELSLNSLLYVSGALALVLPMGLASALALQNLASSAALVRTLLLLPWTLSMGVVAFAVICSIPIVAIFILAQRWFISGLTAGAVKG